jgi:soluble lytic murein transglycosylase
MYKNSFFLALVWAIVISGLFFSTWQSFLSINLNGDFVAQYKSIINENPSKALKLKLYIEKNFPGLYKYWDKIVKAGEKYNVDPFLLAAIIEHESNFQPTVVSYKNAIGIAQIIPSTAAMTARRHGIKEYDLFNPSDNINLSAAHISDLEKDFPYEMYGGYAFIGGHLYRKSLIYRVAAYNAGSNAAIRWRSIGETNAYVPRVLSSYSKYRNIVGILNKI